MTTDHYRAKRKETMKHLSFLCCFVATAAVAQLSFVTSFTIVPPSSTTSPSTTIRRNKTPSSRRGDTTIAGTITQRKRGTATRITSTITSTVTTENTVVEQEQASLIQSTCFSFPFQVTFSPSTTSPTTSTTTIATTAAAPATEDFLIQEARKIISEWYDGFIGSTSFFQRDLQDSFKFTIPLFQHTTTAMTTVTLSEVVGEGGPLTNSSVSFRIHVDGTNEKDYAMLCARIYESQQEYNQFLLSSSGSGATKVGGYFATIDNKSLKDIVRNYFRQVKPHPGYDAKRKLFSNNADENNSSCYTMSDILKAEVLEELLVHGFVTVDTNVKTTALEIAALSNLLTSKTTQERAVRSDTVSFIDLEKARECGIHEKQFRMLMEVADYLNRNLDWDSLRTGYNPIFPATEQHPLTNPANIQIASYGYGEFYVPHSDNLLLSMEEKDHGVGQRFVRSNYRQFTCILYCNDEWNMKVHGGALRIYPGTSQLTDPMSVKVDNMPYTDINPTNGKLLIFDSRLVHSVEKILDPHRKRLAMTIWINRPEDSGVSVNVWNENEGRVEWYRLF